MREYKNHNGSTQHDMVSEALFKVASICSEEEIESALIQENMWDVILNALMDTQ